MKLLHRAIVLMAITTFVTVVVMFGTKQPKRSPSYTPLKPSIPIGILVDTPGCLLPKFKVVSSEVEHIYERVIEPFSCIGKSQLIQSRVSVLIINKTILWDVYVLRYARCRYWNIVRNKDDADKPDESFSLADPSGPSYFDDQIQPETDAAFVECQDKYQDVFYRNYHAVIAKQKTAESLMEDDFPELNIIILGVDSVSKLNFLRHFEKTRHLLSKLDAIELHGYNKVEDSTLVNLIPFLTGKYLNHYWDETKESTFDHVDFSWRYFKKLGYKTLFAEDFPLIGSFNYQKKGFIEAPADHYYRPYAASVDQSFVKKRSSSRYCIDDRTETAFLIDYVDQFVDTYLADSPFYAFSWSSRMTHDYINMAGFLDGPYHDLIEGFNQKGVLNNTVVVFLSDHGIRFGPILQTYVGRFEQRLPFCYLLFPPWFKERYPSFYKNMKANERRLVTPFDLYETQKDILKLTRKGVQVSLNMNESPGISIFREIPKNRTCEDATVAPHFCACDRYEKIDQTDSKVVGAAKFAVAKINERTLKERDICVNYDLDTIQDAAVMVYSRIKHNYRVVFLVKPGDGIFESTIALDVINDAFKLEGRVTRISRYGDQSSCTKNSQLKPYCLCSDRY